MTATPAIRRIDRQPGRIRAFAVSRPILTYCVFVVGVSVALIMGLLIAETSVIPGKVAQVLIVPGTAVVITAWSSGRAGVRRLFAGLVRWRIGLARWLLVLFGLPMLTLALAAATGTLRNPAQGWLTVAGTYLGTLVVMLVTANLLEEMAWTGFVQTRLMARSGLLRGSLLTAIPVFAIHLPLSYEANGFAGTPWQDALLNCGLLALALPAFRCLAGILMIDTGGSVLAVGVLHASFNASGAMEVTPAGWQYVPALLLLAGFVLTHRALRGRRLHRHHLPRATHP
jgi:membrane protease YdiL (CAAX protease family)